MAKAKKPASTEPGADAGATKQTAARPAGGEAGAKAKKPAARKRGRTRPRRPAPATPVAREGRPCG